MAIMAAEKSGINIKDIFKILNKIKPITGRLKKSVELIIIPK